MAAPSILIRDTTVVTQDAQRALVHGDILVESGRIAQVGKVKGKAETTIDGRHFVAIPGLVNAHNHIAMHTMRGAADDLQLEAFLDKTFAIDARRTSADIEAGARLGALELVKTGTTSFIDLYYDQDAVARGTSSLGLRSFLGWAVLDQKFTTQKGNPVANAEAWAGRARSFPLVEPLVAPQGVYVCSEDTYMKAKELAARLKLLLHTHLSETRPEVYNHKKAQGLRPVEWLDKIGFLGPNLSAAHCVWLTMRELDLMASSGTTAVNCPTSNMKLASGGVSPLPEMFARKMNVALGTDGVSSNNSVNMFEEMKQAALLQKATRWDARLLPAQQVFDMATLGGAAALGKAKELGSIEVGKRADIVLIDRRKPTLAPMHNANIVSNLVYSGGSDIVDTVIVNGRVIFEGGKSRMVDEADVVAQANAAARDLLKLKEE